MIGCMNMREEVEEVLAEYGRLAGQVDEGQRILRSWKGHEQDLGWDVLVPFREVVSEQELRIIDAEDSYLGELRKWVTGERDDEKNLRGYLMGARDRLEDPWYGRLLDDVEWIPRREDGTRDVSDMSLEELAAMMMED